MDATPTSSQPTPAATELLDVCLDLAKDAADLIVLQRDFLAKHGSVAQVTSTKTSPVDPVTAVDKAAEQRITERLKELRPDDGILGEEGADVAGTSGVLWIVDPIDGTVNFLYGLPVYAVSIGAALHGELVAGCVVNVANGDVYSAAAGEGAFVERGGERRRLIASRESNTDLALVATGFAYDAARRAKQAEMLRLILPRVRDIRRLGSAALDLCHVAEGRVDAYYEHGTHPWDYAAGAVIAAEAGAKVVHPGLVDRADIGAPVIAAAPRLWEPFADLLAAAGADQPLEGP
ncbi:inositol monophosphatase [Corynebacterium aquatimens]|uniref:inositol monophosphatase family protein n=1 Tax=Corynebacterium TaxID=1716 RepID=UPI001F370BBA|nr:MULTISPECIES: inositol monophosphatase family protein [Corynebacterium]QYH19638.1 inositol monophosphatase [Corynebacterium aquatimens]UIZ91372.1 inositol monophosphatase [Corynebacterium sp. CNCTC7651]